MLGEQRAETKLTIDEMGPYQLLKDSVLEWRGREGENCFHLGSRGSSVGRLVTGQPLACGQRCVGWSLHRPMRLSSYRVELKLKIRPSGRPTNQQGHSFPVMSLQMWGSTPGCQHLAWSHHHLWNYICPGTI